MEGFVPGLPGGGGVDLKVKTMTAPDNINADISPRAFEELVKEYLTQQGQPLKSFKATHDIKLKGPDGEYQIDVLAIQDQDSDFTLNVSVRN